MLDMGCNIYVGAELFLKNTMFLTVFIQFLQNHVLVSLLFLILVLTCIYFWNYIRVCYYASKIPGPPAYPIIGNAIFLLGLSHQEFTHAILKIAEDYQQNLGRIWFGPIPAIGASNPDIVQELLTNENVLEKAYLMKKAWNPVLGKSILTSEVPEWKHHRSIIIRGFTPIILKSYFKIFVEKINILIQKLDLELNKETPFDIFEYLSRTTLDSVCGSTMGVNINSHEDDGSSYFHAVNSSLYLVVAPYLNPIKFFNIFYRFSQDYKMVLKNRDLTQEFTKKIISEKQKLMANVINNNELNNIKAINRNVYKKPFLEYLMDFTKNNSNFTEEQLHNETNVLIFAGYETTAITLSFVLLHMAAYKDIQTKLYNEIIEVLGDKNVDSINVDDLPKLKYMEMVLKESLRLTPTVPLIPREASQDIKIDNYTIPKGANILIPIINIHRNPEYWENPLKFNPERFTSENIKNRHPYAYLPFGAGPRSCLGRRYAWIFMKTALVALLSRYEFHTDINLDTLRFEAGMALKLVNGYPVRITPRYKS
uniref:Cytochrome P450 CYP4416A2 n=1 Tax=Chrysoperla zastrowi sillemi TaxID=482137 RepID=A0A9E7YJJ3_9NEOP|nr:cytochrome P450 CYP4416A2 [Chrysoperla zastrowi sillemi]